MAPKDAKYKSISTESLSSPLSRVEIKRNMLLISLGFLFMFTFYHSAEFIQSILHEKNGSGVIGMASHYMTSLILSLIIPSLVIAKCGYKWTIVVCTIGSIPFAVANFFDSMPVIVIGNTISGASQAPLWVAKSSLLTQLCIWYSEISNELEIVVLNRFMGIFFMIFNSSKIWGSLMLSLVITIKDEKRNTTETESFQSCVSNMDHTSISNSLFVSSEVKQVYILCGIWIGLVALSVITLMFLNNIKVDDALINKQQLKLLLDTMTHFTQSTNQKLLMPINIFTGLSMGFFTADFTKYFVACLLGIRNVGYVTMCYGIVNTISCVIFGYLVEYIGQIACLSFAFVVNGSVLLTLLLWEPTLDTSFILYILAGFAGLSDSVVKTQMMVNIPEVPAYGVYILQLIRYARACSSYNDFVSRGRSLTAKLMTQGYPKDKLKNYALYGCVFQERKEAAFSNWHIFENLGVILSFSYSAYITTNVKLYILLGFLITGATGYFIVAYRERDNIRK